MVWKNYNRLQLLVKALTNVIVCAAITSATSFAQPAPELWNKVVWPNPVIKTPQAIASQTVKVETKLLKVPGAYRLLLLLPDGKKVIAIKQLYRIVDKDQYIWHGNIENDVRSVVIFSLVNDTLAGDIVAANGDIYRVKQVAPGIHLVEQLDRRRFPHESASVPDTSPPLEVETDVGKQGAYGIDVMVLYTPAVFAEHGNSADSVRTTINQLIYETNMSYLYSNISQRVNLVREQQLTNHTEKTNPDGSHDIGGDLDALRDEITDVHDWRRASNADIVVLLTKMVSFEKESCGLAHQMSVLSLDHCKRAFAVVPSNCAVGLYSFGHELGHIMGADHDGKTAYPLYPYSHGHSKTAWRSMMALGRKDTVRILHWSNPEVTYDGVETGLRNRADNALTLNNSAATVANFLPGCP